MSENIIHAAVQLIDVAPTDEFVETLGRQLLADLEGQRPTRTAISLIPTEPEPPAPAEYVALAPDPSRAGRVTRPQKLFVAVAACLALVVAGAVILSQRDDSSERSEQLADVDSREAQPLADAARVAVHDVLGAGWGEREDQGGVPFSQLEADTTADTPQCADLRELGIWSPTTKSVTSHQIFQIPGNEFMYHEVMVFASAEDASKAMDTIESDLFRDCTFKRFDRLAPLWPRLGTTSHSSAWAGMTEIAPHGDRQIVIGQHLVYQFNGEPGPEFHLVNAYIQVGRAIAWVDPVYNALPGQRDPGVEKVLSDTTASLEEVFGD